MRLTITDAIAHAAKTVNEDLFDHNDQAAWIFDGASGIVKDTIPGAASDPHWLVHTINEELKRVWNDDLPTRDLLCAAAEAAIARYYQLVPTPPPLIERPTACFAMARLWQGALEISTIYDCVIFYKDANGIEKFGNDISDAAGLVHKERDRLIAQGTSLDNLHTELLPYERAFRAKANIDGGYNIIDLTTRWIDRMNVHKWDMQEWAHLLLTTDGLYRLVDTMHQYDAESLLDAIETHGLDKLYKELREIEGNDPACTQFPRAKISDDICAAMITVS